MIKKNELLRSVILFFLLSLVLFWPLFKGFSLFPGNYLLAWFEPYKSENFHNGTITIAHKPVGEDVFRHIYPFKTLAVDILKRFELPLWNPYNGAGQPLMATVNSGLIDPANILFIIFPYLAAWNVYIFLQFLLIGFFTYLYARVLKLSVPASVFTSVSFGVSGVVIGNMSFGVNGLAISMLPLILYIIEKYHQETATKLLFLLPAAIFAIITSTHPQISLYIIGFSTFYLAIKTLSLNIKHQQKLVSFAFPFLLIILGVGLAAVQIIPTAELLYYSNFGAKTRFDASGFLLPFYHMFSLFIPNFFGNPSTYNYWGKLDYAETVVSFGLIPCFFAYLYIFFAKKNSSFKLPAYMFLGTFVLSICLVVDSPISRLVMSLQIPIISTDPPSRIFIITTFCACILAGAGFEWVIQNKISQVKKIIMSAPYFLAIILLTLGITYLSKKYTCNPPVLTSCFKVAFRNTILEDLVFGLGFLIFLMSGIYKEKLKSYLVYGLIFLVFVSGMYNAEKFLPFSPNNTIFPTTNLLTELSKLKNDGRVFGFGNRNIETDFATYFKFYDPQYYHPLYIRRYGEFTAYADTGVYGLNVLRGDASLKSDVTLFGESGNRRQKALSLLNVTNFIYSKVEKPIATGEANIIWQDDTSYIVKNTTALPRAFLVSNFEVESNSSKILGKLFSSGFDPRESVIVEKNLPFMSSDERNSGSAKIDSYHENGVEVSTNSNKDSILVLLDNYYPGWNAYIDSEKTPVYRANYTFRAIVVPKGNHIVKLVYEPMSVTIGEVIFALSALLLIVVYLLFREPSKIPKKN